MLAHCESLGAIKSFDATSNAGVKRYIIVSALDVRDKSRPQPDWYDEKDEAMSKRVWGVIGPYLECSKYTLESMYTQ